MHDTIYRAGAYCPIQNKHAFSEASQEEGDAFKAAATAKRLHPTYQVFIQRSPAPATPETPPLWLKY